MPENTNDLPSLRQTVERHGLIAKKSLGQNFLLDLNLTGRIAEAASVAGATVYEVGPGPGGLTRALLAQGARVIAVERDERCLAALAELATAYPGQLDVVYADALSVDETTIFAEHGIKGPVHIAANLPYNIATALLVKWLTVSWPPFWASLTLMFQKEVAQRIAAEPGDSAYGRISVLTAWRAEAKILFDIPPGAFVPAPKVTSSVIRITPRPDPVAPAELALLEKVTAAAFGHRRKMLRQSLKSLCPEPIAFLEAAGIDPTLRAEKLSVTQFAALARLYAEQNQTPDQ
ncbi:MAG: 16S rRNA (adenine(1518)-N(6)/adenine(1519)-N(6))-dimethyltransferase RsmA [Rhizomicrobium sp.]